MLWDQKETPTEISDEDVFRADVCDVDYRWSVEANQSQCSPSCHCGGFQIPHLSSL